LGSVQYTVHIQRSWCSNTLQGESMAIPGAQMFSYYCRHCCIVLIYAHIGNGPGIEIFRNIRGIACVLMLQCPDRTHARWWLPALIYQDTRHSEGLVHKPALYFLCSLLLQEQRKFLFAVITRRKEGEVACCTPTPAQPGTIIFLIGTSFRSVLGAWAGMRNRGP
jgi:hypothetical protein